MKLNDREWKEFYISGRNGAFELNSSASGIDENKIIDENIKIIPYVTRKGLCNGIKTFIGENQNPKYYIDRGNVITIGLDTQTVFYQPYRFYTGQNIQILSSKELEKESALYIVTTLKAQISKFNWGGNGATLGRLLKSKVLLPINEKKELDYKFMHDYIKERMDELIVNNIKYIKKKLNKLNYVEIEKIENKKWSSFRIGDLFDAFEQGKSKGLNHLCIDKDGISYLGATNRNNGVKCFVENKPELIQRGNCIGFIRNGNGSVGYSIYKKESFISTSDITFAYAPWLNEYNAHFIVTVSNQVRGLYNHGYKRSDPRLLKESLMLPVNDDLKPDYDYMEQYVKNIFIKKYTEYLDYYSKLSK